MTRVLSGVVIAAAALAAILYLPPLGLRILVAIVAVPPRPSSTWRSSAWTRVGACRMH